MHASPHVGLVSRSLLGCGGSITFYCLCPWSTVLVVSCGVVGGQQRLMVSCTLAYVTSYHLTPSVTSYIFKWLFPIPWFVACWFPFIPVVVSLSKDKIDSAFVCCRCDAQFGWVAYLHFFSAYIIHLGWVWVGGVGLITSLLLRTYFIFTQLPATLRYHLVDATSQELL